MKILVIGDSCTDKFIYGKCNRLCPEAPVPVFTPINEVKKLGMAGNVLSNLLSLNEKCILHTNKLKPMKTRFVDDKTNQMLLRVDEDDKCERIEEETLMLYDHSIYHEFILKLQAVVISDYDKGFLTKEDIKTISEIYNCPIFLDTKKELGEWCRGVDFIKINDVEYENTKHTLDGLGLENKLIVTKGGEGCRFQGKNYPTKKCEVKDLSGAGDTFLAGLVHKYVESGDIEQSLEFANKVATQVVQKRGINDIEVRI